VRGLILTGERRKGVIGDRELKEERRGKRTTVPVELSHKGKKNEEGQKADSFLKLCASPVATRLSGGGRGKGGEGGKKTRRRRRGNRVCSFEKRKGGRRMRQVGQVPRLSS